MELSLKCWRGKERKENFVAWWAFGNCIFFESWNIVHTYVRAHKQTHRCTIHIRLNHWIRTYKINKSLLSAYKEMLDCYENNNPQPTTAHSAHTYCFSTAKNDKKINVNINANNHKQNGMCMNRLNIDQIIVFNNHLHNIFLCNKHFVCLHKEHAGIQYISINPNTNWNCLYMSMACS